MDEHHDSRRNADHMAIRFQAHQGFPGLGPDHVVYLSDEEKNTSLRKAECCITSFCSGPSFSARLGDEFFNRSKSLAAEVEIVVEKCAPAIRYDAGALIRSADILLASLEEGSRLSHDLQPRHVQGFQK